LKLPSIDSRKLCKLLEKAGFRFIRQKGSHRIFQHPDGRRAVVPMHSGKILGKGLLNDVLKKIKMSRREFFGK